jgi:hypothetical protein
VDLSAVETSGVLSCVRMLHTGSLKSFCLPLDVTKAEFSLSCTLVPEALCEANTYIPIISLRECLFPKPV